MNLTIDHKKKKKKNQNEHELKCWTICQSKVIQFYEIILNES